MNGFLLNLFAAALNVACVVANLSDPEWPRLMLCANSFDAGFCASGAIDWCRREGGS